MNTRILQIASLVIGQVVFACIPAAADDEPGPPPPVPSYAVNTEHIEGRIEHIDGKYSLILHDVHGYSDRVRLHQGTVINPIGLTLSDGMRVRIYGRAGEHEFFADEIETPYHYEGVEPIYVPYGAPYPPPYPYPYGPYYGYGPAYYGPGFDTTVIIGGGHWRR